MKRCLAILLLIGSVAWGQWKIAGQFLTTEWGKAVTPENVWPEYPRPQMVRSEWMNLNGLWDYALEPVDFTPVQGLIKADSMTTGSLPSEWTGQLLIPFAIDAPLSGVMHVLKPTERIWYRKTVTLPDTWQGQRILLHVGAADWETSLYVNGKRIDQHRGGYDPFSFDITAAVKKGKNEIALCCWDGTEQQCQAIGKQIMPENRQGFRYQPTGGIWQTVWLEPVPETAVDSLQMTPDVEKQQLRLLVNATRGELLTVEAVVLAGPREVSRTTGPAGQTLQLPVPEPMLWSPEKPFLYDLKISLKKDGQMVDQVATYFGMRHVEVKKATDGFMRVHLNGKPIFQLGPLDQGYWPDGILTPPSDEAARFDLAYLKSIGCNMVRVHIKKHPARWYYWADKLGLLVWQDMICTPKYGQTVDAAASAQWRTEFSALIDSLYNHPSIVQWIVFNEAWGQHDTLEHTRWAMSKDPSRIVTAASGWTDFPAGHIYDVHDYSFYPNVASAQDAPGRAIVIGELGGHNLYVPKHTWYENVEPGNQYDFVNEAGRATFKDGAAWREPYDFFWQNIRCLTAGAGLNAVVYTQITDVEHECNGWLTYDRQVSKIEPKTLNAIHQALYQPVVLKDLWSDNQWKYTQTPRIRTRGNNRDAEMTGPWMQPQFDDSNWASVQLPMTQLEKPANNSATMVLRKTFDYAAPLGKPAFRVVIGRTDTGQQPPEKLDGFQRRLGVDFPLEIYLNGKRLRKTSFLALDGQDAVGYLPLRPDETGLLKKTGNALAVVVQKTDLIRSFDMRLQEMTETDLELYNPAEEVNNATNLAEKQATVAASLKSEQLNLSESVSAGAMSENPTYQNPVIDENMADPAVLLHEGVYYLYATGDVPGTRGYRVWTSENLIDWQRGPLVFRSDRPAAWAPDVWRDPDTGKFYLYYTVDRTVGVAEADDPCGPFVNPRDFYQNAIDAHLFRDDDGKLYLYYVQFPGFQMSVQRMADPVTPAGEPKVVLSPQSAWEKNGGNVTEGPWMIKHQGRYYLLYSGSHAISADYAVGYAVANDPMGPFKRAAHNPIIRRSDTVFGPGHGCAVRDASDGWWHVYHQKVRAVDEWKRFICIDPLWFDEAGQLHGKATRGTKQEFRQP